MADYIDREKLLRDIEEYHLSDGKFQHWVEIQHAVDVEHVIRCRDCRHSEDFPFSNRETVYCNMHDTPMCENDFCSRGEGRKSNERV